MISKKLEVVEEAKNILIEKYDLVKKCTTRNNVIWGNEDVVLIQNTTTGDLKFKRNLR